MAISYDEFRRYSAMSKDMEDLQQQLNDAVLANDDVKIAFLTDKIVFSAQFLGLALTHLIHRVHVFQKGN